MCGIVGGVSADNTLMIGDSTFDIIAGKVAGTATCAVTFGNHDKNTLQDESEFMGAFSLKMVTTLTDCEITGFYYQTVLESGYRSMRPIHDIILV